jgi:hypothetical protein
VVVMVALASFGETVTLVVLVVLLTGTTTVVVWVV